MLHFRRLVEAGIATPEAWLSIADAGLDAVRRTLVVTAADGTEQALDSLSDAPAARSLGTHEVRGEAEPQTELVLPYRGRDLRGAELRTQLDRWVTHGVMEPSAALAVGEVIDHPEWLPLEGRTVGVLGAGAEMGPLPALLRWGATVAAVDLPAMRCGSASGAPPAPAPAGCSSPRTRRPPRTERSARTCWPRCPRSPTGWPAWRGSWSWATTSTPTAARTCASPPPPTLSPPA